MTPGKLFLQFLTIWNVFLVIAHRWTHPYIDLLLTSTVILFASTYLLYVSPGYFRLVVDWGSAAEGSTAAKPRVIASTSLLLHVLFHLVPFLFILFRYGSYYAKRPPGAHTLVALSLFSAYMTCFKFEEVYDVGAQEMLAVGGSVAGGYVLITSALALM